VTAADLATISSAPLAEQDKTRRLVDDFFAGRKQTTLRTYRQGLLDFTRFLEVDTMADAVEILLSRGPGEANHLALTFKADMTERGLASNTINSRLTALRSVVKLARRIGMVSWVLEVDGAKGDAYRDTAGPGLPVCRRMLEEVTRRMAGPPRQRSKAVRDRAILRLLFDLALRRSSLVALDLEDVDLEAGNLRVWSKGHDQQEHHLRCLPRPTAEALADWIGARGDHPGPLFVSLGNNGAGSRLTGTSIWRIVDGIAQAVGERVWPHAIRHSSITEVVDQSRDIRLGRIQGGHATIGTTQRYLDNLENQELDEQAGRIAAEALGCLPATRRRNP
jgi:integrase/recombinase XerC